MSLLLRRTAIPLRTMRFARPLAQLGSTPGTTTGDTLNKQRNPFDTSSSPLGQQGTLIDNQTNKQQQNKFTDTKQQQRATQQYNTPINSDATTQVGTDARGNWADAKDSVEEPRGGLNEMGKDLSQSTKDMVKDTYETVKDGVISLKEKAKSFMTGSASAADEAADMSSKRVSMDPSEYDEVKKEVNRATDQDPSKAKTSYSKANADKTFGAAESAGLGGDASDFKAKVHKATKKQGEATGMSDAEYDKVKKDVHRATSEKPQHSATSKSKGQADRIFDAADEAGHGQEAKELKSKIHKATQLHGNPNNVNTSNTGSQAWSDKDNAPFRGPTN